MGRFSQAQPGPLEHSTVLIYDTQALLKLKLYNEAHPALTILIQFPAQSGAVKAEPGLVKALIYKNY